jgi:outer membrane protein
MMTRLPVPTLALISALAVATGSVAAQEVPSALSLASALEIARTTNPGFLQTRNDEALADWNVRQSYGQLLPTANATGGINWQGSGETQFTGGVTLGDLGLGNQPSYYGSSYGINLGYSLNWATIIGPKQSKAERSATLDGIGVAEANLVASVTSAYVEILRQEDAVRIAEIQLENNRFNLRLAQGQLEVGQVTPIDVGQAEILVGRAEVTLLQRRNLVTTSRMRLLQLLGLPVDQPFETTTNFDLSEPTWDLEALTAMALGGNPALQQRRSSTVAAEVGVSSAWSAYMPTLSINTGWSGFTRQASNTDFQIARAQSGVAGAIGQCVRNNDLYSRLANPLPPMDCGSLAFTDAQADAINSANDQFPFDFVGSPARFSVGLSIPIFQGLSRQRNLEAARLQRDDFQQQVREQELAIQADLAIGLENIRTLYQSALLEERNRTLAEQQTDLARERYRLGAITFVELVDAQTLFAQADADRTVAIFLYHDSVTNLEALVGASLR